MGKIELDHTGSGSGVTLSSDGTDLLLDGTAIGGGGGGADLYAANPSSATDPSATGANALAIGSGAIAQGSNDVVIGTDSDTGSLGDNVAIGNNARGENLRSLAIGYNARASSRDAIAIGTDTHCYNNEAVALGHDAKGEGTASVSLGKSLAAGTASLAATITNNTATYGASGSYSVAIGRSNKATTTSASVLGGYLGSSTATYSTTVGGRQNLADASYSVASGYGADVNGIIGKVVHSPIIWISAGDTQSGKLVLTSATTNATATALTADGGSASTTNQIVLPNNSAYAFHGTIVSRQQASAGTASAAWKVEGLIRREGSAGTTVLVNSATTVLDNTPSWGLALSADTTNGGLAITVTGAASTNIRWVATIHTSEVTYA